MDYTKIGLASVEFHLWSKLKYLQNPKVDGERDETPAVFSGTKADPDVDAFTGSVLLTENVIKAVLVFVASADMALQCGLTTDSLWRTCLRGRAGR